MKHFYNIRNVIGLLFCAALISVGETTGEPSGGPLVCFGDSITQLGDKPDGYITLLRQTLTEQGVTVVNAGVGGHKTANLLGRVDRDVLALKPSAVLVFIGANDIWHWDKGKTGGTAEEYRRDLGALVEKIRGTGARVIVCSPAVIGEALPVSKPAPLPDDAGAPERIQWHRAMIDYELNAMLDAFGEICGNVAAEQGAGFLDVRGLFREYLLEHNPERKTKGILTYDGAHLSAEGNRLLAQHILERYLAPSLD
jgi:lysophospholipase L1-like esterase